MPHQYEAEGVFHAAELPLNWVRIDGARDARIEQWQHDAAALLRALAVIETPVSEKERELYTAAGKATERLEAKLDLLLGMVAQLARQQIALPPPRPVVLRAGAVEWIDPAPPEAGQTVLLSLHISPRLPQALVLPVRVRAVEPDDGQSRVLADFAHLTEETAEWLERTLFRFHRRDIQQARR